MRASMISLALALPFLAAACNPSPYRGASVTPSSPPPPPDTVGALGTPYTQPAEAPLAGSSTAPLANPNAPMRMSARDVAAVLSNNTASGVTKDGAPYHIYYAGDGQERFREGSYTDTGTWRVLPDGRFCSTFVRLNNDHEQCYVMYRTGNTISFQAPDGVSVGSVAVTPGNPQRL